MTTPYERTRALRLAGDFIREILLDTTLSADLRRKAGAILRHYPPEREIDVQAIFQGYAWSSNSPLSPTGGPWLAYEGSAERSGKHADEGGRNNVRDGLATAGLLQLISFVQELLASSATEGAKDVDVPNWVWEWIAAPQFSLGWARPIDLLDDLSGADTVRRVLGAIVTGVYV